MILKEDIQYSRVKASHKLMLLVFLAVFIWSAIKPFSYITWLPLAVPTLIFGIPILLTYKKFKFSTFVYLVILIHAIIVLIGAKYTYTFNPLFDYLMRQFDLNRNYYDRLGHFAQGFTPALMAKEILLRKGYLKKSKIFYYIVFSIVLALSASFELSEFAVSKLSGMSKDFVLSLQGDKWDTQWDMIMALLGATTALTLFKKAHDKSMKV
ncbi:MAG: putative membrane protein [Clostridium sp.]|jgi:putative membrane protein